MRKIVEIEPEFSGKSAGNPRFQEQLYFEKWFLKFQVHHELRTFVTVRPKS